MTLRRQPTSPISRNFPDNVAKKPAVGGLLALGGESPGGKFDIFRAAVPKISAYLRQGGRFLEKRVGACVRLHCVTGLAVSNRRIFDSLWSPFPCRECSGGDSVRKWLRMGGPFSR